jgi:uncharacterized protein YcgI (DUF1989 family)
MSVQVIPPRSGVAVRLGKGDLLTVIDAEGMQVSDLVAYSASDVREVISNGRTLDYAETLRLTTGHTLYSNRSVPMLTIIEDQVGRHDFLLTPCSEATFKHFYPEHPPHRGCFGNLAEALSPYGIRPDMIPVAFNCFMNVPVDDRGRITVEPPVSQAGDLIRFRAEMDLIVGLTACSAYASNGGSFKPIHYFVDDASESNSRI